MFLAVNEDIADGLDEIEFYRERGELLPRQLHLSEYVPEDQP